MNKIDMGENSGKIWKVLKTEPENYDTTSLYLEGDDERFKKRRAGQWVSIRILRDDGWSEPHQFTISCAPEDQILRLTIKKAGPFTSSIQALKGGTPLKCQGPFGVFCRDIDTKEAIAMIAGGVGVTPFLSVLRHFRNIHAKNRAKLFWTNKTINDVFASNELNEMTKELNLTIVHTISREKGTDKYFQPDFPNVLYVPGYATREVLQKHVDFPRTSFYLCGPPKMQDSVVGELGACGVDPESVERENFSYQGAK
jgi:predicted ferric reductase